MKLFELKTRLGFPLVPGGKHTYILNKSTSVEFAPNNPSAAVPKDDELGRWEFFDGNYNQIVTGKFKEAVKKAVKDHMRSNGSSFSQTLKVIKK